MADPSLAVFLVDTARSSGIILFSFLFLFLLFFCLIVVFYYLFLDKMCVYYLLLCVYYLLFLWLPNNNISVFINTACCFDNAFLVYPISVERIKRSPYDYEPPRYASKGDSKCTARDTHAHSMQYLPCVNSCPFENALVSYFLKEQNKVSSVVQELRSPGL